MITIKKLWAKRLKERKTLFRYPQKGKMHLGAFSYLAFSYFFSNIKKSKQEKVFVLKFKFFYSELKKFNNWQEM